LPSERGSKKKPVSWAASIWDPGKKKKETSGVAGMASSLPKEERTLEWSSGITKNDKKDGASSLSERQVGRRR